MRPREGERLGKAEGESERGIEIGEGRGGEQEMERD